MPRHLATDSHLSGSHLPADSHGSHLPAEEASYVVPVLMGALLGVAVAIVLRTFVVATYYIPSESMVETLQVGDLVLAVRVGATDAEAGDVVTFTSPTDGETILIKRVIACEGQTIDLVDGVVYVDGEATDEGAYVVGQTWELGYVEFPYTVPEGCVFVMGDNRENSQDSRVFGAVSRDSILAVAKVVIWPLSDLSVL